MTTEARAGYILNTEQQEVAQIERILSAMHKITTQLTAPAHLAGATVVRTETFGTMEGFTATYEWLYDDNYHGASLENFHNHILGEWKRLETEITIDTDSRFEEREGHESSVAVSTFASKSWLDFRMYQIAFEDHMELAFPLDTVSVTGYLVV